jgi:hypothetical protein
LLSDEPFRHQLDKCQQASRVSAGGGADSLLYPSER